MSTSERQTQIDAASASDTPMDARTIARLNSAALNQSSKDAQLHAIDSLVAEMRAVLRVVVDELKSRRWLPTSLPSTPISGPSTANNITGKKSSSAVDPLIARDDIETHSRTFTFPFDSNTPLCVKIDGR